MVEALGLPSLGHFHTHGVGVSGIKPAYRCDVTLEGVSTKGPQPIWRWTAQEARVFADSFDSTVEAIIGMNVLRHTSFFIYPGGRFELHLPGD